MHTAPALLDQPPAVARLLNDTDRPLTLLLEEAATATAGHPVTVAIKVLHHQTRPVHPGEARALHAGPDETVLARTGQLKWGDDILACTSAVIRVGLLPGTARDQLAAGLPLGTVLAALPGCRREPVATDILHSGRLQLTARMWVGDTVVAVTGEIITPEGTTLLAR
jgi:chorismate-pyruvate lyase